MQKHNPITKAEVFFVKIITAFPNNRFIETRSLSFTDRHTAYSICDDIQAELDDECAPARTYVTDASGFPLRAGLAAHQTAQQSLGFRSTAQRRRSA